MYEIYGTKDCRYCKEATAMLSDLDLEYTYKGIDTSVDYYNEYVSRLPTARTVPQIFKNGNYIGSSMEDLVKELRTL